MRRGGEIIRPNPQLKFSFESFSSVTQKSWSDHRNPWSPARLSVISHNRVHTLPRSQEMKWWKLICVQLLLFTMKKTGDRFSTLLLLSVPLKGTFCYLLTKVLFHCCNFLKKFFFFFCHQLSLFKFNLYNLKSKITICLWGLCEVLEPRIPGQYELIWKIMQ